MGWIGLAGGEFFECGRLESRFLESAVFPIIGVFPGLRGAFAAGAH